MFEATYESKYGYKFKSFDLNKMKYMELLHTGYELRDFRMSCPDMSGTTSTST